MLRPYKTCQISQGYNLLYKKTQVAQTKLNKRIMFVFFWFALNSKFKVCRTCLALPNFEPEI